MEKKMLPKLSDLHSDIQTAFKNDEFKLLCNQPPHASWVKRNKYANNAEYLPIDKIEFLLDRIFQLWKVEVLDYKVIYNTLTVSIRLHYLHPVTNEWLFHDGVGASEIQTKKESGPLKTDFSNINTGAIEMALPIAKSTAIKDAADHIGKIFGRDLNRKDTINFVGAYQQKTQQTTNSTEDFTL
jgi:hypothetical protein